MIFGAYGNADTDVEAYLKVGIRYLLIKKYMLMWLLKYTLIVKYNLDKITMLKLYFAPLSLLLFHSKKEKIGAKI